VPTFKVNLVSETQLMSKGVSIYKYGKKVSLADKEGEVFMQGQVKDGLVELQCQIMTTQSMPAFSFAAMKDWGIYHQRLGHPCFTSTVSLLRSNAILGVMHDELPPSDQTHDCKACVKAKQTRASFPVSNSRCTRPMQLLHSDLMGPFKVPSLGKSMYVATLLDDFSGYGEVFCLKDKKSVQETLPYAIVRFQRQSGYQVKAIRTDRGTEYKGQFSVFLKKKGIVHQRSSPYTPEQNGLAERYNRPLIERTRALLLHFNLPTILWGEAIVTASYLINFVPMRGSSKTPWELFYDVKPSNSYLRVFGCLAMVHHPPRLHQNKTDAVSEECMFPGYVPDCKSRKFLSWRTGTLEIIESVHVVWREDQSPTLPQSALTELTTIERMMTSREDWCSYRPYQQ
jgi:hypothetical protein